MDNGDAFNICFLDINNKISNGSRSNKKIIIIGGGVTMQTLAKETIVEQH